MKKVLAIESSCDETALAIYDDEAGLLAHQLYSQVSLHQQFGGVVPELASREHLLKLMPLLDTVLAQAQITLNELDVIAYTAGPGLVAALMVGAFWAKSLAYALNIPSIGIHHMEGHLLAPMLCQHKPAFPFLALLVSGGHTLLASVKAFGEYQILGQSLDDAAGEAFDKTAKLLGMPYPGGPYLAKVAQDGDSQRFNFPRPMCDKPGLDFSFSGLKTSVLHVVKKHQTLDQQLKADISASFQEAVVETLYKKCQRALKQTEFTRLVVAGGVSANLRLRDYFADFESRDIEVFYPEFEFCTDNAAMIAYVACQRFLRGEYDSLSLNVRPRWPLDEL